MNKQKKLSISMGIFFLIIILLYSLILINIKSKDFLLPKVENKMKTYIKKKFKDEENEFHLYKVKYKVSENAYYMKISNKNNKNLYFKLKYSNKSFSNTYKKDYLKGKTLLSTYEERLKKNLHKNKKFTEIKFSFNKDLNKFTTPVKNVLINDDGFEQLEIYSVSCSTMVKDFNQKELTTSITSFYEYIESNNLNPSTYNITITNKNTISEAIEIDGLSKKIITSSIDKIISGIIKKDDDIIMKYNIKYKYLN